MSTQQNKAIARRAFEEGWNKRNYALADELVSADYVIHDPNAPPGGWPGGPTGMKAIMKMYLEAFPDTHFTIEAQIAEGEMVVTRWSTTGKNTGSLMGMPASGKVATVTGIGIDRIADGKIAENWGQFDALGMMRQLGVIPEPAMA